MYFGTSYGGTSYGASTPAYSLAPKPQTSTANAALPSYTSSSYVMASLTVITNPSITATATFSTATTITTTTTTRTPNLPSPSVASPHYSYVPSPVSAPRQLSPIPPTPSQQQQKDSECRQCETTRKQTPTVEVVGTNMSNGFEGPVYQIKLNINGRSYVASRNHSMLKSLVEQLKAKGYRILNPFPEVGELVTMAPAKAVETTLDALPFYEGFGYSIKSVARSMLKNSAKSLQLEQISQRIDGFLKSMFLEVGDEDSEQCISQFFWEPIEKELPPVLEEEEEVDYEEEVRVMGGGAQTVMAHA